MPRKARNILDAPYAHLIARGINKENLFYDESDFDKFFSIVEQIQDECSFTLEIMCLMSNHVHILSSRPDCGFPLIMKKILVHYAQFYNAKYDRTGHVFEDRYLSEPVNDDNYFFNVSRYIFQNPQKAGICPAEHYPHTKIFNNSRLMGCFDSEQDLINFLNGEADDCLEFGSRKKLGDKEILNILSEETGSANPQYIQSLDAENRKRIIRLLKQKNASIRSISRLTGINKNIIHKA